MNCRHSLFKQQIQLHTRGRGAPRVDVDSCPSKQQRARGMPGAQCTRSLVRARGVKYAHEYSQRRHRKHPAFPTRWFYGLWRTLPGDEFLLPPSSRGLNGVSDPVGPIAPPRNLTPATGARTTRFDRPQQCRSSRAPLSIAHEFDLAPRPHAHTTSSRPPHPAPRFVTIGRNAPLHRGGMGRAYKSDLPDGLSDIFFARGLDRIFETRGDLPVG
jgi:hypothetical protein